MEAQKEIPAMLQSTSWIALGAVLSLMPMVNRAMAAGAFDGSYAGMQTETKNNNSGYCQNLTRPTRVVIANSVIKYQWGVPLEATVGADGAFSVDKPGLAMRGASATITFKGRVSGVSLEADVGSVQCAAHMSLKKS